MITKRVQSVLAGLGLAMLGGLLPAVAWACSCAGPVPLGLLGTDGQLPANARGLLWDHLPRSDYNPKNLAPVRLTGPGGKLLRLSSEKVVPVPGRTMALLRPAGGFRPGQSYTFAGVSAYGQQQQVKVSISKTVLQPHKGSLELDMGQPRRQEVSMMTRSGSCSVQVNAMVLPIKLRLPAAAEPFKSQFYYQTLIDGKELWHPRKSLCDQGIPGVSWLGERATDQLYTACASEDDQGLKPGRHTVEMQATLPGTGITFRSERVSFETKCPS